MNKTVNRQNTSKLLSLLLIVLMLVTFTACGKEDVTKEEEKTIWSDAAYTSDTTLGKGEKNFTFKVTAGDKSVNFDIHTDESTVGNALETLSLLSGDEGEYGLYVKYVNGIHADYETDGAYWAFYINGELAPAGVDMTEIEDGALYEMRYTKQ